MSDSHKPDVRGIHHDSWQQSWLDHFHCDVPSEIPYPKAPLSALLEHSTLRFPERAACTLYGQSTTYAQMTEQAQRLAQSLKKLGIGPGKYVGMLLPNTPEYLVAMQATWLTGATVLQLSPLMVADEIHHWLEATGCNVMVALDLLAPNLTKSMEQGVLEHVVITSLIPKLAVWKGWLYRLERIRRGGSLRLRDTETQHTWDQMQEADPFTEKVDIDPLNDVAVLAPTGGTTASPKAVELTHRNLFANAMQLRHWCAGEDGEEGVLGVLPFFHSYGLTVSVLTTWAKASTIHLYPRFEARAVLDVMLKQKPELVPAVPAMINALNVELRKKKVDLSFVRQMISGAAGLPASVRSEHEGYGVQQLIEGYGLTEASPVTHTNPVGEDNRPGTIGKPLIDTEARIVDPSVGTEELPVGAVGELIVRGPQVMKGYFNNPLATGQALRDGWLYTGDMARCDENGYYTIVDRKKDIIKTSGFLVFPAEVEEVLLTFPAVSEAAVIGQPDLEKGEIVKAMIVPHDPEHFDLAALEAHCKEHLGKHKRPREIEVVTELPKNFLGKVLRRRLREGEEAAPVT